MNEREESTFWSLFPLFGSFLEAKKEVGRYHRCQFSDFRTPLGLKHIRSGAAAPDATINEGCPGYVKLFIDRAGYKEQEPQKVSSGSVSLDISGQAQAIRRGSKRHLSTGLG